MCKRRLSSVGRTDRDRGAEESEVCEGYQVTKLTPPHQDGQRQWGDGQRSQSFARETDNWGRTHTDRLTGATQDELSVGVERTDLLGGWGGGNYWVELGRTSSREWRRIRCRPA